MDRELIKRYFGEDSEAWLTASYEGDDFSVPTALLRANRAVNILEERFQDSSANIIDLGCGAGQICNRLAKLGYHVTGVDQSKEMIAKAVKAAKSNHLLTDNTIEYYIRDILDNGQKDSFYDAVISLGVIGYLSNDSDIFHEANRLLRPDGIFVLSCRNRLFNMVSISENTILEVESGKAKELIKEIMGLYQQISIDDATAFVKCLGTAAEALSLGGVFESEQKSATSDKNSSYRIQPRQHSPRELVSTANDHGFTIESFYGIHPHLLMAGLNRCLPEGVYNSLSSSLDTIAHHPASLIWSSHFIGVFRKSSDNNL